MHSFWAWLREGGVTTKTEPNMKALLPLHFKEDIINVPGLPKVYLNDLHSFGMCTCSHTLKMVTQVYSL